MTKQSIKFAALSNAVMASRPVDKQSTLKQAYAVGFVEACCAKGIDPDVLMKLAQDTAQSTANMPKQPDTQTPVQPIAPIQPETGAQASSVPASAPVVPPSPVRKNWEQMRATDPNVSAASRAWYNRILDPNRHTGRDIDFEDADPDMDANSRMFTNAGRHLAEGGIAFGHQLWPWQENSASEAIKNYRLGRQGADIARLARNATISANMENQNKSVIEQLNMETVSPSRYGTASLGEHTDFDRLRGGQNTNPDLYRRTYGGYSGTGGGWAGGGWTGGFSSPALGGAVTPYGTGMANMNAGGVDESISNPHVHNQAVQAKMNATYPTDGDPAKVYAWQQYWKKVFASDSANTNQSTAYQPRYS